MPLDPRNALQVLVPVDFSETSRRALAWAFDYALRAPCALHVLHVVEDKLIEAIPAAIPAEVEGAEARYSHELAETTAEVEAELRRMATAPGDREEIGKVVQHVARGHATREILRVADKIGAQMIVLGTHGRSGLGGLLIGSVAERVVRHARCTVVCVKPLSGRAAETGG